MNEFRELRALMVYEHENVRLLVAAVLQSLGMRDLCCAQPEEDVLARIEETVPDVLIQDVLLEQGGDGFDLVRRVRERGVSPNPYLPIIVASGHTQEKYVKAAVNAGAHEFVCFPLSAEGLAKRLYSAVFIGRPFVEVKSGYFGPDRRRFDDPSFKGPERRAQTGEDAEAAAREEQRAAAEEEFVRNFKASAG